LRRVLNYTVPNSIIVVAMLLAGAFTARARGRSGGPSPAARAAPRWRFSAALFS